MKICRYCRRPFEPKRSTAEYCRPVCRVYAHRDRERTRRRQEEIDRHIDYKAMWEQERQRRLALQFEVRQLRLRVAALPEGVPGSAVLVSGEPVRIPGTFA